MSMPSTSGPHDAGRGVGISGFLQVLRRRSLVAVLPLVLVIAGAVSVAMFLPGLWSAKAVVRVDRQRIPESLVKSAVAGDVERQLLSLGQEIMSRPRLLKIIEDHRLYPGMRSSPNDAVERMRQDITIEVIGAEDRPGVREESRLVAFTIAYRAVDPRVAVDVANRVADLYVEENSRTREAQAARSSQFLDTQLVEARGRLQEQERRVAEYKERHLSELPEQRDANLRSMERYQQQLQFAQENLRRANERRQLLTRTLSEIEQTTQRPLGPASDPDILPSRAAAGRLVLLRQELNEATRRHGEGDPRAAQVRAQIAGLESRLKADNPPSALPSQRPAAAERPERRPVPDNPYVLSLMQQLDQANVEAKTLAQDIGAINTQMTGVQRRLENTPRRERELAQVTQDYEGVKELFRSLMAKRGEAGITAELEQRQKGETFRVIEPAALPAKGVGPNRMRVLWLGVALALGLSALAIIAAEQIDTSYRTADEVRATLAVPLLSSIPLIFTDSDRSRQARRRMYAAAAVAASLLVVVMTAFVMARGNDALATMLSPKTPLAARR